MILTKKQLIEQYLVFRNDTDEFLIYEEISTKEQRSKAQNRTFYKCFTEIGCKIWYSKETIKQNCLKALFWIEKTKFWGIVYENAIKPSTKLLTREEAILLIDSLIEFWKKLWLWEIIQSRERALLFENIDKQKKTPTATVKSL